MSATIHMPPPAVGAEQRTALGWDDKRGTGGMVLTIVTEASLFAMLFFSYFFLSNGHWSWPNQQPPKLPLAIVMLVILLLSSGILSWGERQLKQRRMKDARLSLWLAIFCGVVFLAIQFAEYRDHWQTLTPRSNSYGSIFYTITTFHAAHVIGGMLILGYVALLPRLEPVDRPPYRPFTNAALYWHFVDIVWLFVVAILYVSPHLR